MILGTVREFRAKTRSNPRARTRHTSATAHQRTLLLFWPKDGLLDASRFLVEER